MNTFLRYSSLLLAFVAAQSFADRQDFTRDTQVTNAKGTYTKHVEQDVNANGYTREITKTNAQGQTATREVNVVRDEATGTRTKTVEGTTFNGKSYSGESVKQRTADGYETNSTFTGPNGKTRTKQVDVERNGNTTTRDVTKINGNGHTLHKTTVKTRHAH